jgi:hypothetical protein
MGSMKRLSVLLLCCGALTFAADLTTVHSVYILSMSHGFDQFLANSLTGEHMFLVVTDPKKADAILTDHIGQSFEAQLDTLLPTPAPLMLPPPASAKAENKAEKKELPAPTAGPGPMVDTTTKMAPPTSSLGRSRGMVFLVDPKSRQVIWSAYQTPKSTDSKDLDRTASDIVSRLKKDLNPPVKNAKK